ncbi:aminoglycoside 6'-N-acetyltransferase [Rhizobium glycinendophyticum]|uniref:Aminoglycoside N(6')-acetyltransferase type 1 n=1 Tax=Rhizobium glycinendophyticum TaxID=2589807 RepID=A0A504UST2_9HYPH|nr:aminoglycoside 6'-N-acetyltransferase [Rhizobium glycinendophyticum]TPP11726.1 GNAT family N-acetyltransferase [Rhizobium glycinendophyticum]
MTRWLVRVAGAADLDGWGSLRHSLWPHLSPDGHREEVEAALAEPDRLVAFLCFDGAGQAVGLAEASLRSDYVNGCETSPVAFLEGIVVAPALRRQGIARALTSAVCDWARSKGVREIASDADIGNSASHAMHEALGFEETQRVVYFRRPL